MKELGTDLALYGCLLLLFLVQDGVEKISRRPAVRALWVIEGMSVCILKLMGSLKGLKHRGQRVTVGNRQSAI